MVPRPSSPAHTETTDNTPVPTPVEAVPAGLDPFTDGQPAEPPVVRTLVGTLPAPADLTPKELETFELMNDPLRAKVLEIRERMNAEARDILEARYALGSLIVEIHEKPEVYGHMSDIHMAQFFGDGGKTIYAEARRIRERYTPEEFQQILTAQSEYGRTRPLPAPGQPPRHRRQSHRRQNPGDVPRAELDDQTTRTLHQDQHAGRWQSPPGRPANHPARQLYGLP